MKTLLVCERSGGHVFPALALGQELRRNGRDAVFFVTSPALKERLLKDNFKVYGKSFTVRNVVLEGVWRFLEAVYLLIVIRPGRVIGFGGRDSFFLVLFSSLIRRRNTWIYEPNAVFGKANKVLSFFVGRVLRGIVSPQSVKPAKVKTAGIPLRDNIERIDKDHARQVLGFDSKPVILCFGGSQGASFINKIMMRFVQECKDGYNIIHLTGEREYFQISQLYNKMNNKAFVKDFYYSMETLYSAADLVISRAGASTLGEIAYYKLPAILIPYPGGGRHQKRNAGFLSGKGAAFMFLEEDFSFDSFKDTVIKLLHNEAERNLLKDSLGNINLGVKASDFYKQVC